MEECCACPGRKGTDGPYREETSYIDGYSDTSEAWGHGFSPVHSTV